MKPRTAPFPLWDELVGLLPGCPLCGAPVGLLDADLDRVAFWCDLTIELDGNRWEVIQGCTTAAEVAVRAEAGPVLWRDPGKEEEGADEP